MPFVESADGARIYWEVHGEGPGILLGFPVFASEDTGAVAADGYLEKLTDRYRVVVVDYPGGGRSDAISPERLTVHRVCDDLLRVASSAGLDRFCWWGFSWGGLVGLQLGSRTDRLAALVCGAYPPLGQLHLKYVDILRTMDSPDVAGYLTFYESLSDWPEAEAVSRIDCPRLSFVGSDDEFVQSGVTVQIAAMISRHRDALIASGWQMVEVPGRDHSLGWDPAAVVPIVREFLDALSSWEQ